MMVRRLIWAILYGVNVGVAQGGIIRLIIVERTWIGLFASLGCILTSVILWHAREGDGWTGGVWWNPFSWRFTREEEPRH